jgi:hypothetical protein
MAKRRLKQQKGYPAGSAEERQVRIGARAQGNNGSTGRLSRANREVER